MSLAILEAYPYGESFQKTLLALAWREPKFLADYREVVNPAFFDAGMCRHLAMMLLQFFDTHSRLPDADTSRDMVVRYCILNRYDGTLREPMALTVEEVLTLSLDGSDWVRSQAIEFAQSQSVKTEILKRGRELAAGRTGVQEVQEMIVSLQRAIDLGTPRVKPLVFREIAPDLPDYLSRNSANSQVRRIPTGLTPLDEDMHGGLGRGNLGVIMGRTKRGKSHVLVNFGANALRAGYSVHHVTIQDLSDWDVAMRYGSNLTNVQSHTLDSSGASAYRQEMRRVLPSGRFDLLISEFSADQLTPSLLRSHLSSSAALHGFNPDLIILDYADLMVTGHRVTFDSGETASEAGWLYRQLMSIAKAADAGMWTGSQTNREGSDRELAGVTGVAKSYEKMMHAHAILSLNQSPEEALAGRMRVFTAGLRGGPDGKVYHCLLDKSTSRLMVDPTAVGHQVGVDPDAAPVELGDGTGDRFDQLAALGRRAN